MKRASEKLSFEKVWLMFQETDKKFQETEKLIREMSRETDRKFQETDRKFQETDKKLRKLEDLFIGQWGKLMESLVDGNLTRLLQERGIDIQTTSQRVKSFYKGKQIEIDILAKNGMDVVAVEVKTTLKVEHVKDFIKELKIFKKAFSEYKDKNVFGAMAFLRVEEEADKYAYKQGLFVIKATVESARIVNDKKFKPKNW
jgi:Holliday junction resolvase